LGGLGHEEVSFRHGNRPPMVVYSITGHQHGLFCGRLGVQLPKPCSGALWRPPAVADVATRIESQQ
jgi:hypothetical protein